MKQFIKKDKTIQQIIDYFLRYSFVVVGLLLPFFLILLDKLLHTRFSKGMSSVGKYLLSSDSQAVTIATVFIGIYLTLYTLLNTLDVDSFFAGVSERTFKFYNRITFLGVLLSLIFVLISLFEPILNKNNSLLVLVSILFFWVILNFLQLTIFYWLALRISLAERQRKLLGKKQQQENLDVTLSNLEQFLKNHKEEIRKQDRVAVSKQLKNKESK